jgi:hypothetical protein
VSAADLLKRFAADFAVPFLMGGRCVIKDPLGVEGLAAVRHGMSIDIALKDACDAQFTEAALFGDVTPAPFDHDTATLLFAVHELFATCHPQALSFYARTPLFCQAATHEVESLPRTLDPGLLVTRHLVVRRAFRTTRTDVHLKWWTGNASFYGEEPPWRLKQWPAMRRLNEDRRTDPMWRIALAGGDEEVRVARQALMCALLDVSPLSRLLFLGDPVQKTLGFSLALPHKMGGKQASILDSLDDRPLARAVVDALLSQGIDVSGPPLALALLQGLREGVAPHTLRRAAELCTHLALLACLVEGEAPGSQEARPLRQFLDGDPQALNEAGRVYWSVVAATLMLGEQGDLFQLPDLSSWPQAAQPLLEQLRTRARHKRVAAVAEPLVRELGRRLPTTATAEAPAGAPPG